ncbi:unnamed protein product, partial [marine sediment metagenome]
NTCLEFGITPNYVVVSDAQISFKEYGEIDPKLCKSIKLFISVTGSSEWSTYWVKNGGEAHYYLNKDNIRTHKTFSEYISFDKAYLIPASSNVGNTAYVFSVLVLGYSEVLLSAYDYSYKIMGNYYGNQKKEPLDFNLKIKKHNLNNHFTGFDINNDLVQISHNMQFSAKWLIDFIEHMHRQRKCKTINITGAGILRIPFQAKIKRKEVA